MTGNGKKAAPELLAQTDHLDVHLTRPPRYGESPFPYSIGLSPRKYVDERARFALACIERWAVVAGEPNGEDAAGRQKLRRMTADEIVAHACACAEKAFAAFETLGWTATIPPTHDLLDRLKDRENSND